MGEIGILVLLALGYPFFAAWIVGTGRSGRIANLEREVAELRRQLQSATNRQAPEATQRAASEPGAFTASASPPPADQGPGAGAPAATPDPAETDLDYWIREPIQAKATPRVAEPPEPEPVREAMSSLASATVPPQTPAYQATPADTVQATLSKPVAPPKPPAPPTPPRWLLAAKDWFLTGNPVAKIGLVILFIGVAFLLKYVAATVVVPIELRLAGVVLADLALLGWGWRLRTSRREIGLPVQGTAIAILMLVIFGAFQRYGLLPAGFAFALLVALTVFTCILALLQDAVWLAVFGIVGGFACPLLVSTGQGNHIALFSYYALLNAGVFALAVRRSWRALNLLGFAFTFVVGAAWGGLRYTPDNYLSAQGFLLLFFLFYVGIALAYARRQQTRLKDYVDATLVLGTPLLAFGLQVGLVKDKPFGLALWALALGGFYLALAIVLWRRGRERWRVLVESFMSLGVVFGTLAIPFALDARWTSGAWAVEGAGFVWIGLKRGQRRTWLFGMLLQLGAWLSFGGAAFRLDPAAALSSNLWLGFVVLAFSAFVLATGLRRHAGGEAPVVSKLAGVFLAIAAVWLLGGWWTEAILRTRGSLLANWLVGGAVLTTVLLGVIAVRMAWRTAGLLALGFQIAGAVALLVVSVTGWDWLDPLETDGRKPLLGIAMIALAALATSRMLARATPGQVDSRFAPLFLAWGALWWFGPVINIAAARLAPWLPPVLGRLTAGWLLLYALGVAGSSVASMVLARRLQWPQLRWLGTANWLMLAGFTFGALVYLYAERGLLAPAGWLAWLVLLLGGEFILRQWPGAESAPGRLLRQAVHTVRTAGPWLALWPTGGILVDRWLGAPSFDVSANGAWALGAGAADAAWSNYLPTWLMMLALAWLLRRSRADAWPARPLSGWYRAAFVPAGALLVLLLATVWNLGQDGTMAPLPYLPLLNPLDLTTGFALALWAGVMDLRPGAAQDRVRLRIATLALAYGWFNLILLRSSAHWLGLPYRFDVLADSQVVQAMLSLVWSASALVLMRYAARRAMRRTWSTGAVLLGIVVGKLFLVDLANGGSMARVVSFVGVGLLMLLIGYFAPFPKAGEGTVISGSGT